MKGLDRLWRRCLWGVIMFLNCDEISDGKRNDISGVGIVSSFRQAREMHAPSCKTDLWLLPTFLGCDKPATGFAYRLQARLTEFSAIMKTTVDKPDNFLANAGGPLRALVRKDTACPKINSMAWLTFRDEILAGTDLPRAWPVGLWRPSLLRPMEHQTFSLPSLTLLFCLQQSIFSRLSTSASNWCGNAWLIYTTMVLMVLQPTRISLLKKVSMH